MPRLPKSRSSKIASAPKPPCPSPTCAFSAESVPEPAPIPLPLRVAAAFDAKMVDFEMPSEGPFVSVTDLQLASREALLQIAREREGAELEDLSTDDLILAALQARVERGDLLSGHGTLEVLEDGFGFLRRPNFHYINCPDDIYVSPSQIRKFGLRTGAVVCGQIRPPKINERYFALLRVHSVNDIAPDRYPRVAAFDTLTPLHPRVQLQLEHDAQELATRLLDLFVPLGFGQRALLVSPSRIGKTKIMQAMARGVLANYPQAYVFMLMVDERPEEVTETDRVVHGPRCEVISSTFDEPTYRHLQVAEIVLEKAKRRVEVGADVVVFLDSITRLVRAWNHECEPSGRTLSGGLDAAAIQPVKAFFGSARKVEQGGSLTMIASALSGSGSRTCDVILEEFKGTGNLEIVLDRALADQEIWPPIDVAASRTRNEEKLLPADALRPIAALRRRLSAQPPQEALKDVLERLRATPNNAEFLRALRDSEA